MKSLRTIISAGFLASALVLAGCGGGGNDNTSDTSDTMDMAKTTAMSAISVADAAAKALNDESDDTAVTAARTAISNAVAAIDALPDEEQPSYTVMLAAAERTVSYHEGRLAAETNAANDEMRKMDISNAKALNDAIRIGATAVVTTSSIAAFDLDGAGSETDESNMIPLKKGEGTSTLGAWTGTEYKGSEGTGDSKNSGTAWIYSNAKDAKGVLFISEAGTDIHGLALADSTSAKGDYALAAATYDVSGFPSAGTESYDEDDTVTGAFMGAGGTFKCIASAGCTAVAASGKTTFVASQWTFTPTSGAMLNMRDNDYLQFGWWLREDKDGPTHAGAFYGMVPATGDGALTAVGSARIDNSDGNTVGQATYIGIAAGKFAVSDPVHNDYQAGHFTADAELKADFKTSGSTLSGMIDNFVGPEDKWEVELKSGTFDGTASTFSGNVVWSINEETGARPAGTTNDGDWQAQMFEDVDDDNSIPDSAIGRFDASIGQTHSLVGGFGAGLKEE